MQMIRQDDHCVDVEGPARLRYDDGIAQGFDMFDQQAATTVQQIDREKIASAWNEDTTIVRHVAKYDTGTGRCNALRFRAGTGAFAPYDPTG